VGKEDISIHKGVMQGSILSPALFNIYLEPLIDELSAELGYKNVLAYADDIALLVTSFRQLDFAIERILAWSELTRVPINHQKSAIMNIKKRHNSTGLVTSSRYKGYPVQAKYKYLGVWLSETLDPKAHISEQQAKLQYLARRLRVIPKKCVSPKLLANLWTMCYAALEGTKKISWYNAQVKKSFKWVMGLKASTRDMIVIKMMGYDPILFAAEQVRRADSKWRDRRERVNLDEANESDNQRTFHVSGSNILISWPLIKINNLIYGQCRRHSCPCTPLHLSGAHEVRELPDMIELIEQGTLIDKRLRASKRKGRVLRVIDEITGKHKDLYSKICNGMHPE